MIDKLLYNVYFLIAMICGLLLISSFISYKKQKYYSNRPKDKKAMERNMLNTKYHLDEAKKVNLEYVNKYLFKFSVMSILTGTILAVILAVCGVDDSWVLIIGILTIIIVDSVSQTYAYKQIAQKYHRELDKSKKKKNKKEEQQEKK